jgi:polar amino acid transport system substrate-binding protein
MNSNKRGTVWRLLTVLAVLGLVLAACGGDSGGGDDDGGDDDGGDSLLAQLQDAGTITVGIANEIPYGYEDEDTGEVTGQAPEVARVVLAELGIDNMEAVVVEFGALIGGLQAGNFDMITAGMYINADRAEQILFADPDYCILESLLVPEGNPDGFTNYNSVAGTGKTMAVASGTVNVDYAVWAGLDDDQIVEFAGIEDQYDAIAAGRVDTVSGTILTVSEHADAMEGFEALPPFPALDEDGNEILGCGGAGFLDQGLRDAYNDKLNELQDEGVVQQIVDEQFAPATGMGDDAAKLTVEDLIGG